LLRYHIQHAQAGNLLEIKAHSPEKARDRIRLEGFGGDAQALVLNTDVEKRVFHVHQLRGENADGDWRSIHIQNALVNKADLRVHTLGGFEAVEVSGLGEKRAFDLELRRYCSKTLAKHNAGRYEVAPGTIMRLAPADWNALGKRVVATST
jgi:hypothetical protein